MWWQMGDKGGGSWGEEGEKSCVCWGGEGWLDLLEISQLCRKQTWIHTHTHTLTLSHTHTHAQAGAQWKNDQDLILAAWISYILASLQGFLIFVLFLFLAVPDDPIYALRWWRNVSNLTAASYPDTNLSLSLLIVLMLASWKREWVSKKDRWSCLSCSTCFWRLATSRFKPCNSSSFRRRVLSWCLIWKGSRWY